MTSSIDSSVVWNSDALIDAANAHMNTALKAGVHITLAKAKVVPFV